MNYEVDNENEKHESLLHLLTYDNHAFIKNNISHNIKELNVVVYFDFVLLENTEFPYAIIGAKFLNENNEVLFDFIVDKYGDGCMDSDFANRRRRNKIQIAISISEYYLDEYKRRINKDTKVSKIIKSALSIAGLNDIEGYRVEVSEKLK